MAASHPVRDPSRLIACVALLLIIVSVPGRTDESPATAPDRGLDTFLEQCAGCHQHDGSGIPGRYPALRDSRELWTDRTRPIRALLAGRSGPVTLDGQHFAGRMPTHGFLGNDTIAATLDFLLQHWGPGGEPYTAEEVATVRLGLLAGHGTGDSPFPGPSPLADLDAIQYVTGDGPPLSVEEFDRARRLYYGHCAGCHGVLRLGTANNPLTPERMRELGTGYLQAVIHIGATTGMPGWGATEALAPNDIHLLAQFLQHPVPQPPDMDVFEIRDGWRQYRPLSERPESPMHDHDPDALFVVTLHDAGEVMLIDGVSRTIVARVPVGRSPTRVSASASGRYLYVLSRDGSLDAIDLFSAPPERVASVRVGYEARALAASRYPGFEDRYVLAGAYWPPQLLLLDGRTLEPLQQVSTRGTGTTGYHPEPRVTDIAASRMHPEFVVQIRETGQVKLFPYDHPGALQIHTLQTVHELRAGSFSADGRYYLTPADTHAVSVIDLATRKVVAEVPARVFGGGSGTAYHDPELGPVWVAGSAVGAELQVIGTDPDGHPDNAWRVVRQIDAPATGSLFLATHPGSPHLWMDTPLNAGEASRGIGVLRRDAPGDGFRTLPVAHWSGLTEGPRRVLQPTFDPTGREVWLAIWNPQDQASAIVVVDDLTLEPRAVIRDPGLITPTRLYSVRQLRNAGRRADGADLYATHCASCHGRFGEGDGHVAPSLPVVMKDLRHLRARNDQQFPRQYVVDVIDGRTAHEFHDRSGMPVWGAAFATDLPPGVAPEVPVRDRIDALADFLELMQRPIDQ